MGKRCSKCKKTKLLSSFGDHAGRPDGLQTWCLSCQKEYQAARRERLRSRSKVVMPKEKRCSKCKRIRAASEFSTNRSQPDGLHNQCNRCRRLLTSTEFDRLYEEQKGKCAICSTPMGKKANVDHCHSTGVVRGLLCRGCNFGLGFFRDDPDRLVRAAQYVEERRK